MKIRTGKWSSRTLAAFMYIVLGVAGGYAYPPSSSVMAMAAWLTAMLICIDTARSRRGAFFLCWGLCWLSYIVAFEWIREPFKYAPGIEWLAPFALVLFAGALSVFIGIAGVVARGAGEKHRYASFALAAGLFEWVRGWIFTGLPWNPVSLAWAEAPAMFQGLSLVGTYGLSAITILILGFPYLIIKKKWKPLCQAAGVAAAVFAFGAGRLYFYGNPEEPGPVVRLVNANIELARQSEPDTLFKYARLSRARGWGAVDLFVWAETSVPADATRDQYARQALANVNNEKSRVIFGFNRYEISGDDYLAYNSMGIMDGAGNMAAYDKRHLVPFGEYMPMRALIPFKKFTEGMKDFSAGAGAAELRAGGMKFLPLICYEAVFPGLRVPGGADFMVNISNDAWFGVSGKWQHSAIASFRAAEEGMPLIRVANKGLSAVFSPLGLPARGREIFGAEYDEGDEYRPGFEREHVADAMLPRRLGRTLFSYTGNWLAVASMAAGLAICLRKKGKPKGRKGWRGG